MGADGELRRRPSRKLCARLLHNGDKLARILDDDVALPCFQGLMFDHFAADAQCGCTRLNEFRRVIQIYATSRNQRNPWQWSAKRFNVLCPADLPAGKNFYEIR